MNTEIMGPTPTRRRAAQHLARTALVALACVSHVRAGETAEPETCSLALRPHVTLEADRVTLADVLNLADADAALAGEIAELPLREGLSPGRITIGHAEVIARLDELGVNLARVLVGGALECAVTLVPPAAPEPEPAAPRPTPAWRRSVPGASLTLGDALREYIRGELSAIGGDAEIVFDRASDEVLRLGAPYAFRIRPADRAKLGLRGFQVTLRRDGRSERVVHVTARIRLLRDVVVARRPLNRGNYVHPDDLMVQRRAFERDGELGLVRPDELAGQQVRNYVPVGQMLTRDDLKAVDMVTRAQRVRVTSGGAGVSLELNGVALESGALGDTIRVRLGESRTDRRTVRGVVTGFGIIRLLEG